MDSGLRKPNLITRLTEFFRVQNLPAGVRLTAIFDSCHSGSALDLPYIYSTQGLLCQYAYWSSPADTIYTGVLKEPNLAKEAGQGLLNIVSSYARGDLGNMASTAMNLFKKATSGNDTYERNLRTKTSPADVIMWSGSKDDQTSYVRPLTQHLAAYQLPECHTPLPTAALPQRPRAIMI